MGDWLAQLWGQAATWVFLSPPAGATVLVALALLTLQKVPRVGGLKDWLSARRVGVLVFGVILWGSYYLFVAAHVSYDVYNKSQATVTALQSASAAAQATITTLTASTHQNGSSPVAVGLTSALARCNELNNQAIALQTTDAQLKTDFDNWRIITGMWLTANMGTGAAVVFDTTDPSVNTTDFLITPERDHQFLARSATWHDIESHCNRLNQLLQPYVTTK